MKVGDGADITRTFSEQDIEEYSRLSGHEVTGLQVPEPLIGALFSYLLGVKLPGLGTNYLKQETRFKPGAEVGEVLRARVEITRLRPQATGGSRHHLLQHRWQDCRQRPCTCLCR